VAEWEKRSAEMGIKTDPSEKEKWQKQKKDVVKHYQDELANTTTAGLLESPAIVMGFLNPLINYPIFIPETEGGHMLVTENPKYFRKDLPKYIPQLFFLYLVPMNWPFVPKEDPINLLEEKFPIEKLQAMIDK
jgi:hypothetical protein